MVEEGGLGPDRLNLGPLVTTLVLVHTLPPKLIEPGELYLTWYTAL